jgi:hypothetical protein
VLKPEIHANAIELRSYFKDIVIFEVLPEVIMKSVIFWGMTPFIFARFLSNTEDVASSFPRHITSHHRTLCLHAPSP